MRPPRREGAKSAALVGINAGGLDADEKLPGLIAGAEFLDRPGRCQRRVMLRQAHDKLVGQRRAARRAFDMACLPAEDVGREGPRVGEGGLVGIGFDERGYRRGLDLRLPLGHKAKVFQQIAADHKTGRLEHVQPFKIGIAEGLDRHASPECRPEIDNTNRLQPVRTDFIRLAEAGGFVLDLLFQPFAPGRPMPPVGLALAALVVEHAGCRESQITRNGTCWHS
jgi:hypothetical protein